MKDLVKIKNSLLGYEVTRELVNNGKRTSLFPLDGVFTKEELMSIETLKINFIQNHEELYKLKNLKSLVIYGAENSYYLNLSSLINLESIVICNCPKLKQINLMGLDYLKKLNVINCGVKTIVGLEDLKNLEEIKICGNKVNSINDINKYMINTRNAKINILDVIMYDKKMSDDIYKYLGSNISFGEMTNFDNHCFYLTLEEMSNLYEKAQEILKELKLENDPPITKVKKIYYYLYNTLTYDNDALTYRDQHYIETYIGKKMTREELNNLLLINSSYGALMNNTAVCDGYVNLMRLLLSMCNIESEKVDCNIENDENLFKSHAAIRVKMRDQWYYADPEREQTCDENTFFALNQKNFQKTHEIRNKYKK